MSKAAILCVDDEAMVLDSLKRQLRKAFENQYTYEFAECADEALEIIEELNEDDVDILVIVSDWLMPGLKGDEFLIRVHEKFPQIVKVLLSGQADEDAIERAKDRANLHACLHKPWKGEELIATIRAGLAKS
ncbi:MAG: response regulator [Cyanobacteriota bacterium]|nr:response regulator [Cyanobacteriota bacterium]